MSANTQNERASGPNGPLFIPGTEFEIHEDAVAPALWTPILRFADSLSRNDTLRERFMADPLLFVRSQGIADFSLFRRLGSRDTVSFYQILERLDSKDTLAAFLAVAAEVQAHALVERPPQPQFAIVGVAVFVVAAAVVKTFANVNAWANANAVGNLNAVSNVNVGVEPNVSFAAAGGLGPLVLPVSLPAGFAGSAVATSLEKRGLNAYRQQTLLKYTVTTAEYVSDVERLRDGSVRVTAERLYKGVPLRAIAVVTRDSINVESVTELTCAPRSGSAGGDSPAA